MVATTHLKHNRQFEIAGLTNESCKQLSVENQNMPEYFSQKHHFHLRHINLPCAMEKVPRKESGVIFHHHPLELLRIVDGQRVPNSKCDNIVVFFKFFICLIFRRIKSFENVKQNRPILRI